MMASVYHFYKRVGIIKFQADKTNYVLVLNNLSVPKKERFAARSYRSCWSQIDKPAFGALYVKVNANLTEHVAFVALRQKSRVNDGEVSCLSLRRR